MSKIRKSILIIGILVIVVAASLATALALFATGSIKTDPIELEFRLKDREKVYDGSPLKLSDVNFENPAQSDIELKKGELALGHTVSVDFIGLQTNVGTSMSDATIKIFDANGFNVTSEYIVKVELAELTVHKKSISVDMPSQKVVYNGSKVLFSEYNVKENSEGELAGLCNGHKIYGSTEAGLMNVGDTLPEDLKPLIFDVAGNDVTANYDIDFDITGIEIEVIPRPLAVRPVSYEKIYDGTALKVESVEYLNDTSLVEGQYARFEINYGYLEAVDVTSTDTEITDFRIYEVINGEETDVTANYEVESFETGRLEIRPRALTIKGKSETFVYDGVEHSLESEDQPEEVIGLVEGETIVSVTYNARITEAETVANVMIEPIMSANSNIENYDVTIIYGTLTVIPYEVTIITGSTERYYNGNELYTEEIAYTLANENHEIQKIEDAYPSITNAGEKQNAYTCRFLDENGKDVTSNYDIKYVYGTLKVNKLPVAVTLNAEEKVVYDGTERKPTITNSAYCKIEPDIIVEKGEESEEGEEGETPYLLPDPESLTVVSTKVMIDCGEYPYTVRFKNKSSYDNYILDVVKDGYLTITPKRIEVKTATQQKAYDGTPLYDIVPEYAEIDLIDGHKFAAVKSYPTITDKGSIENEYVLTVEAAGGVNVSHNYEIDYKYGTLTIESLEVNVELDDIVKNYSGKQIQPAPAEAVKAVSTDLLSAEDFTVTVEGTAINASETSYKYGVKITDKKYAENFNVTVSNASGNGTITINPLPVSVTIRDVTQIYNGGEQTLDCYTAIAGISDTSTGLTREDFKVKYSGEYSAEDAGVYPFTVEFTKTSVASNYALTVINGAGVEDDATLYRSRFIVTINTDSGSFVYDGKEHSLKSYTNTPLAKDVHGITITNTDTDTPKVKNVGTVDNGLTFDIVDNSKASKPSLYKNYEIKVNPGRLTVTPRPVTVSTGSVTRAYNGEALTCEKVSSNFKLFGDHKLVRSEEPANVLPEQTEVGSKLNEFECAIVSASETDYSVNNNYLITYVYGTLTVTPRSVTVYTPTQSWEYDGQPHANVDDIKTSNLPSDEFAVIINGDDFEEITDTGSVSNVFDCKIIDAGNKDVTANFAIAYEYGTLTVTPYALTLSVNNFDLSEYVYNGEVQELTAEQAILAGLPDGLLSASDFDVIISSPLFNAGKYTYTVRFTSAETAKNYMFTSPVGSVTVDKMPVALQLIDLVGGEFKFDNHVKTVSAESVIDDIIYNGDFGLTLGLLSPGDFKVECVSADNSRREVLFAGSYTYTVKFADRSLMQNFIYTEQSGSLTVDKATVEVTVKDYEPFTYNGTVYEISASDAVSVNSSLIKGSDFTVTVSGGKIIKDVDGYRYTVEITDSNYADNFEITYKDDVSSGSVSVEPLNVRVTLKDYSFTFNNDDRYAEIVPESAITVDTALLPASVFRIIFDNGMAIYAGEYSYSIEADESEAELEEINLNNFDITFVAGKIKIERQSVTVTLANLSKVYDGQAQDINVASNIIGVSGGLLDKSSLKLKYVVNTDNELYGVHYYTAEFKAGVDSQYADSFELTCIDGSVNVSKRAITVTTSTKSKEYDGNPLTVTTVSEAVDRSGNLAANHSLDFVAGTVKPRITNVGEAENRIAFIVLETGSKDVTENYEITYVYGKLSVTKKAVTIKTTDASREYDGTPFTEENPKPALTGGAAGHSAVAQGATPSLTDVGSIENKYVCKIVDGAGGDVSANYNISYEYGTLQVTKTKATVTYKSNIKANYKGREFVFTAADVATVTGKGGITADMLVFVCSKEIKNAGTYTFTVKLSDEATKNYTLQAAGTGTITIEKIKLNVGMAETKVKYNGNAQTIGSTALLPDSITPDNLTATDFEIVYYTEMIDAGTYASAGNFGVRFVNSALASNYDVTFTGSLEIEKLDVSVTLNNIQRTYDGTQQAVTAAEAIKTVSSRLLSASDFAVSFGASDPTKADDYSFTVSFADADLSKNFTLTGTTTGTLKINKRNIKLQFNTVFVSREVFEALGDSFLVSSYISIDPSTPLTANDSFAINGEIWADYDPDTSTVTINQAVLYTLTNSDCYEITNLSGLTAALVVMG